MLTTMLATLSTLAALQSADFTTDAARAALAPTATSGTPSAMVTVPLTTTRTPAADDHLVNARRAMTDGQFDIARREFSAALSEERSAGKLPVESSVGLADALYAQAYNRAAAFTMEQLAKDAALAGDVDVEAMALADAIWLHADAGQRVHARKLAARLRVLMKETPLSAEARKAVHGRLG